MQLVRPADGRRIAVLVALRPRPGRVKSELLFHSASVELDIRGQIRLVTVVADGDSRCCGAAAVRPGAVDRRPRGQVEALALQYTA